MLKRSLLTLSILTLANGALAFSDDIRPGFQGESELGSTSTSGNSSTSSVAAKTDNKYLIGSELWTATGRYLRNTDRDAETALYWSGGIRYDHELSDWVSLFVGYKGEADPYAGYVQRDSADLGSKLYLTKRENFYWLAELGYRYSKTHMIGDNLYESFARIYTEAQQNIDKNNYVKVWIEHLANLTNNKSYWTNAEASLTGMLTQTLALKVSYLVKYQNEPPPGIGRTDSIFLTTLVAKY